MESALSDILGDDIMDFQEKNMIESDIVALFAAAFNESQRATTLTRQRTQALGVCACTV